MENDMNVLKFREELIKLCEKYNCELSGESPQDEGDNDMCLCIGDKYYIMEDSYSNYNILDSDYNFLMDNIIKDTFNNDSGEMAGLNNIKVYCGILTNDPIKAEIKIKQIANKFTKDEITYFINSKERKELYLNDNKKYTWIKLNSNSRGYRCGKIIIDRNITLTQLDEIVLPICYACGKNDVEIF